MAKRPKQPKLQSISDVLQTVLKKRSIDLPREDQYLKSLWQKAVGPQIFTQTHLEKLKGDTLFVKVSSAVWRHQLQFLKEEIIAKFNALAGKDLVKSVHFSIGEIRSTPGKMATPSTENLKERDKRTIETSLASVPDQELKDILRRVMIREITRRRSMEGAKAR
jgi:hypothetical protein